MKPTVPPIERVNDFVVKFANVNGSGSASANELFAKSFLRMGIPVSPRNAGGAVVFRAAEQRCREQLFKFAPGGPACKRHYGK